MKTDMFSSLKVIHGVALSTAVSVAASVVIAAAFAAPVNAFAAAADTAPAKTSKKTVRTARSAKKTGAAVAAKSSKAAKTVADTDDAPKVETRRHRVSYTMNGRRHSVVREVAFEPRQPSVGQAFGLHDSPDGLALRSSVAYVIDQNTGDTLFDKNSRAVVPIASISKLMTAMVVLDSKAALTEQIEVTDEDRDYIKNTGSRLAVGSVLSREDMLHIALMASENRAAAALSRYFPAAVRPSSRQ